MESTEEINVNKENPYLDNIDSPDNLTDNSQESSQLDKEKLMQKDTDTIDSASPVPPKSHEAMEVDEQESEKQEDTLETNTENVENVDSNETEEGGETTTEKILDKIIEENVPNEPNEPNETNEEESSIITENPVESMEVDEADSRREIQDNTSDSVTNEDSNANDGEHPTEEVDCSTASGAYEDKENSVSVDPFDSLRKNQSYGDKNVSNVTDNQSNHSDDDDSDNDSSDENQNDASSTKDDEESRNDECLLDEAPEFSEADMQKAIETKEADDQQNNGVEDAEEPEGTEGNENDLNATEKSIADTPEIMRETSVEDTSDTTLKPYEISETVQPTNDALCFECGSTTLCKFAYLQMSDNDDENATPTENNLQNSETHHLCSMDCAIKFKDKNDKYQIKNRKIMIQFSFGLEQLCFACGITKLCKYQFKDGEYFYVCEDDCVEKIIEMTPDRYTINRNKIIVSELKDDFPTEKCYQCTDEKECHFSFKQDDETYYLCNNPCLNLLLSEQPDRFQLKLTIRVREMPLATNDVTIKNIVKQKLIARTEEEAHKYAEEREESFIRHCMVCDKIIDSQNHLIWETIDYCSSNCLKSYQTMYGASCTQCKSKVPSQSLGKYCVRFGFNIRQFCRSVCLNAYKKGWKVCSYCQGKITKTQEFLVPICGVIKEFCSSKCSRLYELIVNPKKLPYQKICSVCNKKKVRKVTLQIDRRTHFFCSNPCFSAFKFVNNINTDECVMCKQFFERRLGNAYTNYDENNAIVYCSKICMTIHVIQNRLIEPCNVCKVRKYSYDMIARISPKASRLILCSLQCLSMAEMSIGAVSKRQTNCDHCKSMCTTQYHLTMSDSSIRNFCTYQCVMAFQSQFSRKPITLDDETGSNSSNDPPLIPIGLPKKAKSSFPIKQPIIQSVKSLAASKSPKSANKTNSLMISNVKSLSSKHNTRRSTLDTMSNAGTLDLSTMQLQPVVEIEPLPSSIIEKTLSISRTRNAIQSSPPAKVQTRIITIPKLPSKISNKTTQCEADSRDKSIQCRPVRCTVGTQTDSYLERKLVLPIPVPIYMPQPLAMYARPFPVPVPFPLPIPIPIFVPTTRNSSKGIMKEIKKIQDKMPDDPFQAELLLMAEMVAGDSKKEDDDSSDDDEPTFPNNETNENNFGDDVIQMAFKFANEFDSSGNPIDMESAMTVSAISQHAHPGMHHTVDPNMMHHQQQQQMIAQQQQQQQQMQIQPVGRKRGPVTRSSTGARPPAKRGRRGQPSPPPPPIEQSEPSEKADANMCLKYTFGVNAWKQWVLTKNTEIEKSSLHRKPFKTELLQMNADELNYSLCLFVKEVRKPNGSEYAPDTIYYLVLGIQQYLYENNRIDNIFTDPFYERFTDCLDEVAKKFSILYNDSQYIVTRVEEEHLWECKQLGAHSPHVLLSTLMFFNTKHFNLTTVDEHMQLSFSHIMKHWKRNPNQTTKIVTGTRNVLLRFYPPNAAAENSRKKKVYEQHENDENPLRCPVKLYEFYLSKCPESVKTRNDVFYLMPERSCVPESPVWYSTQALNRTALSKMLHRVKMVKEINIALLTS